MKGQKSGKPSRPSKFQPGSITHKGYVSDSGNRIMPWWPNSAFNIRFPNCPNSDPNNLAYGSVKPPTPCANPDPRGHRPDIEGTVVIILLSSEFKFPAKSEMSYTRTEENCGHDFKFRTSGLAGVVKANSPQAALIT